MIKVGIAGLGDIAPLHTASLELLPEVVIGAVCDLDEEKRSVFPGVPFYTDYQEMLEKEKLDCVHLCLPHYLHYPAARDAVTKGIHVFCEKPAAVTKAEVMDFVALEEAWPEIYIGICLQNRKNETTVKLKQLIDSGQYGKLVGIRGFVPWYRSAEYYEEKPWRGKVSESGSGVLLNQSIHTLDLLYYLGGEVRELNAMTGNLLDYPIEVEDTAAARLLFENGASGLFFATNANYDNESVSIRVCLEGGQFLLQDNCLYEISAADGRICLAEDQKLDGSKFYYGASHQTVIREFYQAMVQGSDEYIHVRDGKMGIVLAEAIVESAKAGGKSWRID